MKFTQVSAPTEFFSGATFIELVCKQRKKSIFCFTDMCNIH